MAETEHEGALLPCVVRTPNAKLFRKPLPPERHRALHLGCLHEGNASLVEIAAGTRNGEGALHVFTRKQQDHYLPGGSAGNPDWLENILGLVAKHDAEGHELFVGPSDRADAEGSKSSVRWSRWLWVDVDKPEKLKDLFEFFRRPTAALPEGRQPHIVVSSGGSGGMHAYWRLDKPLEAVYHTPEGDVEGIKRAVTRLVYALGSEVDERTGKEVPTVGDRACTDPNRVLRIAGTRNFKTGNHARLIWVDFLRPGYNVRDLVGDLPDPRNYAVAVRRTPEGSAGDHHNDRFKQIPIAEIYTRLTGEPVPQAGNVRCPSCFGSASNHARGDRNPSCDLSDYTWICYGCGAGGACYDMASVLIGGPTGRELRGDAFLAALGVLKERFPEYA